MDAVQELVCVEVAGGRRVVVFADQARRLVDAGVAVPLDPLEPSRAEDDTEDDEDSTS